MAGGSEDDPGDAPRAVSFKQLKRDKFALSNHLKNDYVVAKKEFLRRTRFRDPRFDPRVNGLCVLSDWASLKEDEEKHLKTLKKELGKATSEEERQRVKRAIKLITQRQATEKDIALKKRVKLDLQKQQMENLKAGKRALFITRSQLKEKLKEERLKLLNKKERERYLSRQAKKKYTANAFDE